MKVHELVTKLQVLMTNDPSAADRVVFVAFDPTGFREYRIQSDGFELSEEPVWDNAREMNRPTPALVLTTNDIED